MSEERTPVILITGASRGIAFATAQQFLTRGARVAICASKRARLAAARRELAKYGDILAAATDVTDASQAQRLVTKVTDEFKRIDVLVNNAGRVSSGEFASQGIEQIEEVIDVNLKGVLYVTRAVLPIMLAAHSGIIVNVSSGAGLRAFPGLAVYCASKFAVVGFTESLNQEVQAHGVRVYAICPGRVATDMQRQYAGKMVGMSPERVANAIVDLAGPRPPIHAGRCLVLSGEDGAK